MSDHTTPSDPDETVGDELGDELWDGSEETEVEEAEMEEQEIPNIEGSELNGQLGVLRYEDGVPVMGVRDGYTPGEE